MPLIFDEGMENKVVEERVAWPDPENIPARNLASTSA
jgi:hypothetical protein